jgi:hypothetical protein
MKIDGLDWLDWLHKMRAERSAEMLRTGTAVADAPRGQPQHRPLLYLETSIFGFCFDENPRNVLRREAAVTLLEQVALGLFDAATSALTFEELTRAREPLRTKLMAAVGDVRLLKADKLEVERLAAAYVRDGVIPQPSQTMPATSRTQPLAGLTCWCHSTCVTLPTSRRRGESAP